MIVGQKVIVVTEGTDSGHFFRKGDVVEFIKVWDDFFNFVDETGLIQSLEEEDFVLSLV